MPRCTVLAMLSNQPLIRIRHVIEVIGINTNDANTIYASAITFTYCLCQGEESFLVGQAVYLVMQSPRCTPACTSYI